MSTDDLWAGMFGILLAAVAVVFLLAWIDSIGGQ